MQLIRNLVPLILIFGLSCCTPFDFSRRVVQQGNLLPQSKIERLKTGMSKNDAAILMGTSLLSTMFNNDRWDYAYTWRRAGGRTFVCNARLYFSNDRLVRVEHLPSICPP